MARKIISIRLDDSVWQKAREDAVHNRMTLQDWVTLLILRGRPSDENSESDELQIIGEGIKR